jgi:hypothetical protein
MPRTPEHPTTMPQSTWLKELHGNPKSACRNKNKTGRYRVGRLTKGFLVSLSLFRGPAAAFHFAPSDTAPGNTRTARTTIGVVPTSSWSRIVSNVAGRSTKSTIITPANSTANVTTAGPLSDRTPIQLTVVNSCGEPIWPGIVTQNGIGPTAGGYKLTPGTSKMMFVSADWAGRI